MEASVAKKTDKVKVKKRLGKSAMKKTKGGQSSWDGCQCSAMNQLRTCAGQC